MTYSTALSNFIVALQNRENEHIRTNFSKLTPGRFSIYSGRKFDKIVINRNGSRSVYAFVRKLDGAILRPAGWSSPEPKQYERGNIFGANPLLGTNVYGVDYIR